MTGSYSKAAKDSLLESSEKKKKCCARMLSDILALTYTAGDEDRAQRLTEAPNHFKCASCFTYFLKGLFVAFGNVTNPEKSYHLELSFVSEGERDCVSDILEDNGMPMKKGKRKNRLFQYAFPPQKVFF